MKISSQKMNILLIFIYIFLIEISSENEQKQIERIKNAIYLIVSRANGIIDKSSFTFEYEKYNITLNNLRILKPFNKDITIIKEMNNNEIIFNLKNIKATIICDISIQLFIQAEKTTKYRKIFFEIFFDEIKFKLINDFFIEFSSLNIENITHNNFENLDYFADFNNKERCIFYEEEKEPIILENYDSKLKEIFKNKFEEKIKERQKNFNLFTYDMIQLFDNYKFNITKDKNEYIFFLEPKKIKVEESDINLDKDNNIISINYFKLIGIYKFQYEPEKYFNFTINCYKRKEQFRYERNNNMTKLNFIIKDCSITDDNEHYEGFSFDYNQEIIDIVQTSYANYLKESSEKYFKDIFE